MTTPLGHSNWIISFPLTTHIPTLHPHVFNIILLLTRDIFVLSNISYYWKEYFLFAWGDNLHCGQEVTEDADSTSKPYPQCGACKDKAPTTKM